jgi:phosphoadenosine phosphosulfate reductase
MLACGRARHRGPTLYPLIRCDPMKGFDVHRQSGRTAKVLSVLEEVVRSWLPATFATSFGAEDMVLLDLIARHAPQIDVFTLDTGRLPEETYRLMSRVRETYSVPIRVFCPAASALESFVARNGPNAFYDSVAQRQECCHIRKVEPLGRALEGKRAWVTGLRHEQSMTRKDVEIREWDAAHRLEKFSPLLDWTTADVWEYIRVEGVPYNALHDRGYPSIGCEPCTRAVAEGEDIRSGRWWWEGSDGRECGLHPSGSE